MSALRLFAIFAVVVECAFAFGTGFRLFGRRLPELAARSDGRFHSGLPEFRSAALEADYGRLIQRERTSVANGRDTGKKDEAAAVSSSFRILRSSEPPEEGVGGNELPPVQKEQLLQSVLEVLLAQNCVDPPDVCPNENITFWLFTRSTRDDPQRVDPTDEDALRSLSYGKDDPWKLILHGYTGHRDYSPNAELRPAYFGKGEYNIISVDYGPLVQAPCYLQAVINVPLVANCTARVIDRMVAAGLFRLRDLHVIGFSLGGQVSGHLSRFLAGGRPGRITGLDPALPLFVGNALGKLDRGDADFVDVIHTDAGRKGKLERSGHVDFYPNGGYTQIGCIDAENFTLSGCNHVRAAHYFAESILSEKGFWGIPCGSYLAFYWGWCRTDKEEDLLIMGEYTPTTAEGTYYLETSNYPPYALGKRLAIGRPHIATEITPAEI